MRFEAGSKVGIETSEGAFEGVVHFDDQEKDLLVLKRVLVSNTGKRLHGFLRFVKGDITKAEVLMEIDKKKDQSSDEESNSLDGNAHSNASQTSLSSSLDGTDEVDTSSLKNVDVIIIDDVDEKFYKVLDIISKEKEFGLAMEGINVGRHGRLCWLQIATAKYVFLFDLLDSPELFMQKGLKSVLENPSILKIIHNCRNISDALHHKFKITLKNVFDTQVADVFVYRMTNHGELPRFVKTLPSCLIDHLQVHKNEVYFPKTRMVENLEDQAIWKQRPLPSLYQKALVKNVVYLPFLRTVLVQKLNTELMFGVDLFLSANRDARDEEIAVMLPHVLPTTFQQMLNFNMKEKSTNGMRKKGVDFHDYYGFKDNHVPCHNMDLVYNRDSWQDYARGFKGPPENSRLKIPLSKETAARLLSQGEFSNGVPSETPRQSSENSDNRAVDFQQELAKFDIKPAGFQQNAISKRLLKLQNSPPVSPPRLVESKPKTPGLGRGILLQRNF